MKQSESVENGIPSLRDSLRAFAQERDWDQFHSPKNLAGAVVVEAAELMERFQWLTAEQSQTLADEQLESVQEEMADVLLYLIRLADKLNVDLLKAARKKLEANALKYPIDKSRGNSRKYSEF